MATGSVVTGIADIKSLSLEELKEELKAQGLQAFRAGQIYQWMHQKLASSFEEMTNLSKDLRRELSEKYAYTCLEEVRMQESKLDGTRKYLFKLSDGNLVESVFMRYQHGNSVCISSQVGCKMGCRFCASTLDGWERNLLPSEMLEQIYAITRSTGERISNVVVMGTGEPLDNLDNLIRFIRLLTNEDGLHISQRNITVSTCGLVPQIRKLAQENLQITLALSLHATTNDKRKELMPVANTYPLDEVLEACGDYYRITGRRITFEYSLVGGVNDTQEDAQELIGIAKKYAGHINLIPVNPIKERDYKRGSKQDILAFKNKLEKNGINCTIRREMGRDIDGACGQLRRRVMENAGE